MKRMFFLPSLLLLLGLLAACAATPKNHFDPGEKTNRFIYGINDGIDRATTKPLALIYTKVTPNLIQSGIANFFDNIGYLDTVLNSLLQGKGGQAFSDLGRFLVNSTIGLGGFLDIASYMGLEKHEEDFGQTLAVWGAGQGAYIVYPLYGPSSVRDTPGIIVSTATDGFFWLTFFVAPEVAIPATVLYLADRRARLLSATRMRDEVALDPYVFTREAWRQNREYLIYDGHPPKASSIDNWEEDEFDQQ